MPLYNKQEVARSSLNMMCAVYGIDFNTKYLDFIISPYKKKYLNAGNKINIIIDETNATSFTVLIDLSDGTNDNKASKE